MNKNNRKEKAKLRREMNTWIAATTERSGQDKVKSGTIIREEVQITAAYQDQKNPKKPDEKYQDILAFPETGEISLSKIKIYKVSVLIGVIFLPTHPDLCITHNGADQNLTSADVLDQSWLRNIR